MKEAQLDVVERRLPSDARGGIEQRCFQVLLLDQPQALVRVRRAIGNPVVVAIEECSTGVAELAELAQRVWTRSRLHRLVVDLVMGLAAFPQTHLEGAVPVLRLDVLLPDIARLHHMTIRIDGTLQPDGNHPFETADIPHLVPPPL